MRKCPDCHADVDDEAFFCDQCGFQLRPKPEAQTTGAAVAPEAPSAAAGASAQDEDHLAPAIPGVAQMACAVCGYINLPGEIFCANCGVQLSSRNNVPKSLPEPLSEASPEVEAAVPLPVTGIKSCPTCGAENLASETYCQNCGFWLIAKAQPSTPAAGPESRQTFVQPFVSLPDQPGTSHPEKPMDPVSVAPHEALPLNVIIGRLYSITTEASLSLPSKAEIILGRRDPERTIYPDVDLSDQGTVSNSVSRQHARLLIQDKKIFIEDLNSTNSTYLNRKKLQPGQRYLLNDGDELRLGGVMLVYYSE